MSTTKHFSLLERFTAGKKQPTFSKTPNGDALFFNEHFAAVMDGASNTSGSQIVTDAMVSACVVNVLSILPREATLEDFLSLATEFIAFGNQDWDGKGYRPCTQAWVVSAHHQQLWCIGDCHGLVVHNQTAWGGRVYEKPKLYTNTKRIDSLQAHLRALQVHKWLSEGTYTPEWLMENERKVMEKEDKPWQQITALQGTFQNQTRDKSYDFWVLDGTPIPPEKVKVVDISNASQIVLCSDGFPYPHRDLRKAKEALWRLYEIDPLLYTRMKYTAPFIKGSEEWAGAPLYDDATYLSFKNH